MLSVNHFIEKMKRWPYFLAVNLLLALGIFLCALLGRVLGIEGPALPISVVWPATGLSLAALLLFGYYAGIGVFIGNLVYNILFLTAITPFLLLSSLQTTIMAVIISLGSLAQALMGTYIIRNYSSPLIFRTVQDILIFLIPASLLCCLIGSTVGVTALAIAGGVDRSLILPVWLAFWLGDTAGIYVITPLIVIWVLQRHEVRFSDHIPSLIGMAFLFIIFALATYFSRAPLPHLFVPISIWAAYLFRMHGASLAIFLMTTASISFAAYIGYEGTSLISLITFIGVTIAASLIIAAVVNERTEAWAILDSRNVYLEKEVDVKEEVLEQIRSRVIQQQNLVIKESLSKLLVPQIQVPLNTIDLVTKTSQQALDEVRQYLTKQKGLTPEEYKHITERLQRINQGLSQTIDSRKLIEEILKGL